MSVAQTDAQLVAGGIAVVNAVVFACCRVKRWQKVTDRYFTLTAMRSK